MGVQALLARNGYEHVPRGCEGTQGSWSHRWLSLHPQSPLKMLHREEADLRPSRRWGRWSPPPPALPPPTHPPPPLCLCAVQVGQLEAQLFEQFFSPPIANGINSGGTTGASSAAEQLVQVGHLIGPGGGNWMGRRTKFQRNSWFR